MYRSKCQFFNRRGDFPVVLQARSLTTGQRIAGCVYGVGLGAYSNVRLWCEQGFARLILSVTALGSAYIYTRLKIRRTRIGAQSMKRAARPFASNAATARSAGEPPRPPRCAQACRPCSSQTAHSASTSSCRRAPSPVRLGNLSKNRA